jgi:hypothetical protein
MNLSKKLFMGILLMVMMLPTISLAQVKPRITSPSDRSSSTLGNQVNVTVSGNNIEVIYAGLNGNPNPYSDNESNFYKGTMYSSSNSNHYFTPGSDTWANKWVKIIAHDKTGGGWSDPIYIKINPKPQPAPTPAPQQPTVSQQQPINADRWTNQNTTVYSDWNPNTRRSVRTLGTDTKVYVSQKYTLSNGETLAKISEGYVNANNLKTDAPAPTYTTQTVNADRWTNQNTAVYSDWNPNTRRTVRILGTDTKVYVSQKYTLSNGETLAKISEGYVNANNLKTDAPAPTYTMQTVNADRWTNTNTTVYNDWNPNSRRSVKTLSKDTKVYVNQKYTLSNGEVLAKISEGFVNANNLNTATPAPTYTTQYINADRWTNTNTIVYNDWNPSTRRQIKTLSTNTKVYVSQKYTLSTGETLAKIPDGYVNANNLNTVEPAPQSQTVNAYRWTNTNTTVYNDVNLTSRKSSLSTGTKVYVSSKSFLNNGKTSAKIEQGYVDANNLNTAEPTPQSQIVNAYRWTNTNTTVYNDVNLTSRKSSLSTGTKVYVSSKSSLNNGKTSAKIEQGYVDANNLNTVAPTPTYTIQQINGDRWTNQSITVYSDWNTNTQKTVRTLSTNTKVYVTQKYILSNGDEFAQISGGYVDAKKLKTDAPTQANASELVLTKAEWKTGGLYIEGTYKWLDYLWEVHCIGSNCNPTSKNQYFSVSGNKFSATIPANIYQREKEYKIYVVGSNKNTGQEIKSATKSVNIPALPVAQKSDNSSNSSAGNANNSNNSNTINGGSISLASFAKGTYDKNLYNGRISYRTDGWKIAHTHKGGNWTLATDFWYQIYEKGDNVIIAFRGTPAPLKDTNGKFIFTTTGNWKETLELIGLFGNKVGTHPQDNNVRKEVDNGKIFGYLEAGKRIYITGHSLGGHLAMICYKQILYNGYGYLVDGVETFNAVGISNGDAVFINKNGNYNKIIQHYTCCDIARWASEANGLCFPGKPQKSTVSHKDDVSNGYSHAKLTYEQSIEKIKYLASLVLSGKINSYEYETMGDIMISELTIRATAHTKY